MHSRKGSFGEANAFGGQSMNGVSLNRYADSAARSGIGAAREVDMFAGPVNAQANAPNRIPARRSGDTASPSRQICEPPRIRHEMGKIRKLAARTQRRQQKKIDDEQNTRAKRDKDLPARKTK
jgi:hypothetical protein